MSLKLAIAKLSAAAAGVALLQGGAVRVAEPMNTAVPDYSTNIDGKLIAVDPETGLRYIKGAERIIPEERRRRIVERTIECVPVGPGGAVSVPAGAVQAYVNEAECPPLAQIAYMPAPLPLLPPVSGSGGFGAGGFGGGLGFGGGFFGGFFGGGGSSSGNVSVSTTTSTSGGGEGSSGVVIDIDIDNSTSTTSSSGQISSTTTSSSGQISSSTGQVSTSTSTSTGAVSSSTGAVSSTSTSGNVS